MRMIRLPARSCPACREPSLLITVPVFDWTRRSGACPSCGTVLKLRQKALPRALGAVMEQALFFGGIGYGLAWASWMPVIVGLLGSLVVVPRLTRFGGEVVVYEPHPSDGWTFLGRMR